MQWLRNYKEINAMRCNNADTFLVLALFHGFFQAHTILVLDPYIHIVCHSLNRRIPLEKSENMRI